jgi:hypothetical protein
MQFDRCLFRYPDKGRKLVDHAETQESAFTAVMFVDAQPLGFAPALVLVPALAVDAVWEAAQRHGPLNEMR